MFRKKDFLPREQVVKNLLAFWRDKPGAEDPAGGVALGRGTRPRPWDILEMLINEEPKKIARKKGKKKKGI